MLATCIFLRSNKKYYSDIWSTHWIPGQFIIISITPRYLLATFHHQSFDFLDVGKLQWQRVDFMMITAWSKVTLCSMPWLLLRSFFEAYKYSIEAVECKFEWFLGSISCSACPTLVSYKAAISNWIFVVNSNSDSKFGWRFWFESDSKSTIESTITISIYFRLKSIIFDLFFD